MVTGRDSAAGAVQPLTSPPRATIAFRVGVIGHRPNRLPTEPQSLTALQARLGEVLKAVRGGVEAFRRDPDAGFYADGAARLTVVSSLAEGADRMVAEEGLALGFGLCCPMPFFREAFAQDFDPPRALEPDSRARFDALLDRASRGPGLTAFELDGSRSDSGAAYALAAKVVANQSDLLIAVWDGAAAAGHGGTAESLGEALEHNIPVLWVQSDAPFAWRLLRRSADLAALGDGQDGPFRARPAEPDKDRRDLAALVESLVRAELCLPEPEGPARDEDMRARVRAFFDARRPAVNGAFLWKMFRDAVGSNRFSWPKLLVQDYVDQIAPDWPVSAARPGSVSSWMNASLRTHYAWADKEADRNADAHRSAFIESSLLAAMAVVAALTPTLLGARAEDISIWVEFVVVGAIISIMALAKWARWHERWLEYRVLAELVRQLRLLTPLGGGRPATRMAAHLAVYGDQRRSWMAWQARAIARALGLPSTQVTPDYIRGCVADLIATARTQLGFHQVSSTRAERIYRRLNAATLGLFIITILSVVAHLAARTALPSYPDWAERALAFAAATFPAIGAALVAINNQGEFVRLAKRSRAMVENLTAVIADLEAIGCSPQGASLSTLAAAASRLAAMMVEENVDWRIVLNDLAAGSA